MVLFLDWDTISDVSNNGTGIVGDIARQVRGGVCALYRDHPGFMTSGLSGLPGQIARGVADGVCGYNPSNLPPPPTVPFTGGQCKCTSYEVLYRYRERGSSDPFIESRREYAGRLYGITYSSPSGSPGYWMQYKECTAGEENSALLYDPLLLGEPEDNELEIIQVSPLNGGSNSCGNPAPTYPPDTYNPPPGGTSGDITVTYNDGTDFTFPVVYAPIGLDFNFNVDVGGVTFKLDLGGITISPTVNINTGDIVNGGGGDLGDITNTINNISNTVNSTSSSVTSISQTTNNISSTVNNIDIKIPPPLKPPDTYITINPPPAPADKKEVEFLKWVCITLTQRPKKGVIQSGDGAPDWMAAGWFEWLTRDDGALPRQPIHFDHSCYPTPVGVPVTGYAYTLTNGAEGYATIYVEQVQ